MFSDLPMLLLSHLLMQCSVLIKDLCVLCLGFSWCACVIGLLMNYDMLNECKLRHPLCHKTLGLWNELVGVCLC